MIVWCVTPIIAVIFFAVMILWMASTEAFVEASK